MEVEAHLASHQHLRPQFVRHLGEDDFVDGAAGLVMRTEVGASQPLRGRDVEDRIAVDAGGRVLAEAEGPDQITPGRDVVEEQAQPGAGGPAVNIKPDPVALGRPALQVEADYVGLAGRQL